MEWIKVINRFPDTGKDVLCFSENRIFLSFYDRASSISGDWYDTKNTWIIENVTHWMPLPQPPQDS